MRVPFIATCFFLAATANAARYEREETLLVLESDDDFCIGLSGDYVKTGRRWELKDCDDNEKSQCWDLVYRRSSDRYFRIHPCSNHKLCVEATGGIDRRDKFRLKWCSSSKDAQYFTYDENYDNELTPKRDDDLCVEPKARREGRVIWLQHCDGSSSQGWKFRDFEESETCDYVSSKVVGWCEDKSSTTSCEQCCSSYCDGQSSHCEDRCESDCEDRADCDDISDRCDFVKSWQADRCGKKDSEGSCDNCCEEYCSGQSSYCEEKCEDDCEHKANCEDIRDKCDTVTWKEADNCSKKTSEGDCDDCCSWYCNGQSSYCKDYCEKDCESQADCDDIETCDKVSWKEADNCSKKSSEGDCDDCCSWYCNGQSSYCKDYCEKECESQADCKNIHSCNYVEGWKSRVCDDEKPYKWQCDGCCEWYCDRIDDPCSDCESACEKAADCSDKPGKDY